MIFSEVSLDGLILTANQAILAAAVTKHSEKNRRKMTSRRMRPRPCFLFGRFFCLKDWDMNINLCHELAKPVESSLLFDFNKPIRHKDSMWKTNHPKTFLFFLMHNDMQDVLLSRSCNLEAHPKSYLHQK